MPSQSVKLPTISLSSPLAILNHSSQCCKLTNSVPPGPAPHESIPETSVTVSSVISTGTSSGGQSGYESRLAAVGARSSGCFARSTSITCFHVLVHCSPGCRTPPIPHSIIQLAAVRSFPRSTRPWYVCAWCSVDSYLWLTVRYSTHVHRVSLTNILCLLSSQASRRFSIKYRMAWDAAT